ncbi:hypothetical protein GCM10009425_08540 [Pseudomonas asuensis]|jgi:hypothetical protein|uniref:Uncharacterized protein n=1 Tax=Pseudomonas asuensis TaxID=1825787 RepID=A0ABQ2GKF3_9PSED|nr:hypothetical protein GCM10009425_08540 [Pseudomonas asuensis]
MNESLKIKNFNLPSWLFLAVFSVTVWWAYDGDTCLEQCRPSSNMSLVAKVNDQSSIGMPLNTKAGFDVSYRR